MTKTPKNNISNATTTLPKIDSEADTSSQTPIEIALKIDENGSRLTRLYPNEIIAYQNSAFKKYEYIKRSYEKYGFVYLMVTNTNKCKIGITQNLEQRFLQINQQLITSKVIYLYASPLCMNKLQIESSFKEHFRKYNVNGINSKGEWFKKEYLNEYIAYLENVKYDRDFISKEDLLKK